jgi:predicted nucleic acid-binding protein
MRVFLDTNILLDVLARREPFYAAAAQVWSLAERGEIQAFVSAISFSNIYYIIRKSVGKAQAHAGLRSLRDVFQVVAPDGQIINQAIDDDLDDFEDAVQFHSAIRAKAAHLVTRNPDDFPESTLSILTPEEFLTVRREKVGASGEPSSPQPKTISSQPPLQARSARNT